MRDLALAWIELLRLRLALTGALYTLVGAYLTTGTNGLASAGVVNAACVVAVVIAFGNAINDWVDASADAIAKPHRPIPSSRISRRTAGVATMALAVAALAAASRLRWELAVFVTCTVLVSAAYSMWLKGIPFAGHGSVGLLCGSILIYGGLAAGALTAAGWAAATMTFLYVFAQEVLFAIDEEAGDRASQVATTVTRLGRANGVRLYLLLTGALVLVSLWPWAAGFATDRYLVALIPLTVVPTIGMAWAVSRGFDSNNTVETCAWCSRFVWYSSIVCILLLR